MGFSLKRALLGAVVGGAHAAGEVYDAQLKEAEKNRQRELDLAKTKELQEHADELLANREARKQEMLDAKQEKLRTTFKDIVNTETAALKEKGIGIGTAEGQQAIADAFISAGYPTEANLFADNAQKWRDATDRKELKKIEMANLMATRSAARAAAAEARAGRIELRRSEDFKMADKAYNDMLTDYEIPIIGEDGKTKMGTDPAVKNWIRGNTFEIARTNPYEAMRVAQQLGATVDELRAANPGMSLFKITQMAEERVRGWTKAANAVISGQTIDFSSPRGATPPAAPKSSRPQTPTPSIFGNLVSPTEGPGGMSYNQVKGR